MPDPNFVGQLARATADPGKTSPHAEALTAALRDDQPAVRASIAHLDQHATEQLRHACIRLAERCWDHGTDLILNARKDHAA